MSDITIIIILILVFILGPISFVVYKYLGGINNYVKPECDDVRRSTS